MFDPGEMMEIVFISYVFQNKILVRHFISSSGKNYF